MRIQKTPLALRPSLKLPIDDERIIFATIDAWLTWAGINVKDDDFLTFDDHFRFDSVDITSNRS